MDDAESLRAIHRALDLGIDFFDTANSYGAGHSEEILGRAISKRRKEVVIATKFAEVFEPAARIWYGHPPGERLTAEFVRESCEASLRRLQTDYIDLWQLHWNDYHPQAALDLVPALEDLVCEGKVRWYGWSTDLPESAEQFAVAPHCAAIQHRHNVLDRNDAMITLCEQQGLAAIARGPLSMGLLSGKYDHSTRMPKTDVRGTWSFAEGRVAELLDQASAIRAVLTEDGRTAAQGALAWLWARSESLIPIPGFKSVAQVEENAAAARLGPLTAEQTSRIEVLLGAPAQLGQLDYARRYRESLIRG
jgi:aryl-alcohol dehydrogenase-like predicted oxidoreductase